MRGWGKYTAANNNDNNDNNNDNGKGKRGGDQVDLVLADWNTSFCSCLCKMQQQAVLIVPEASVECKWRYDIKSINLSSFIHSLLIGAPLCSLPKLSQGNPIRLAADASIGQASSMRHQRGTAVGAAESRRLALLLVYWQLHRAR